jgi:Raf kinase inhibitor-like YbhB/YbcL family protein
MIPKKHARKGQDLSPPLAWSDPPKGTQSFVLLVLSDPMPDGGANWVQWALFNIPATARSLPEAVTPDAAGRLPDGSQHLLNSWGELRYGGPNPQHVETRRYYFRIYALDTILDLEVPTELAADGSEAWIGETKEKLLQAMDGHILAQGELIGKYKNQ